MQNLEKGGDKMLVKVLNIIDMGAEKIEKALNKELRKLEQYYINDVKIDGNLAVVLYTERQRRN